MRKNIIMSLALMAALSVQAQSKLSWSARRQLLQVDEVALAKMGPQRDASQVRQLPLTRKTEGWVQLTLSLADGADAQRVAADVTAMGGEVNSIIGQMLLVQVPCAMVEQLEGHDAVRLIEGSQEVRPMCNLARLNTGAEWLHHATQYPDLQLPADYDGTGVLVGIVDTGFDYQHFNFRDQQGRSRIRAVMEVDFDPADSSKYVFHKYETPEAIARLVTDPSASPSSFHSHGSHVTGIAAGSAYLPEGAEVMNDSIGRMRGMAPNADLILCAIGVKMSDANIGNAMAYICQKADSLGLPVSINCSMGSNIGRHDKHKENARYAKELFGDHPGRSICYSAGNEGGYKMSFRKVFEHDGDSLIVPLPISNSWLYKGKDACDIWCDDASAISYNIVYHDTVSILARLFDVPLVTNPDSIVETKYTYKEYDWEIDAGYDSLCNRTDIRIFSTVNETFPENVEEFTKDPRLLSIVIYGKKGQGITGYTNTYFPGWRNFCPSARVEASPDYSINASACNPWVISVGAHVTRNVWDAFSPTDEDIVCAPKASSETIGDIASFSSYGPDMDGNYYPEISAPGSMIFSSMCNYEPTGASIDYGSAAMCGDESYLYGYMQGTSMACPVVTGCIALMLQANKDLTLFEIRQYLADTATHDAFTEGKPNRFGGGKLNALAAVQAVIADLQPVGIEEVASRRAVAQDACYTLSGQRIAQPQKGQMVVRGGRVVVY